MADMRNGLTVCVMILVLPLISPAICESNSTTACVKGIPDAFSMMNIEKGVAHALLVEKMTQTLFVYAFEEHACRELYRFECSTGEVSGEKKHSGDRKTPEGVYFFTGKFSRKYLTPIYGSRAYPLDYPNALDRFAGRSGYSIWMHGTDSGLKPNSSNGCIVLQNKDIQKLDAVITPKLTPIIIVPKIKYVSPGAGETVNASIADFLYGWCRTIETGDCSAYQSFYQAGYNPPVSWWRKWEQVRRFLSGENPFEIRCERLSIFHCRGVYVAIFDLILGGHDSRLRIGRKKIFLSPDSTGYKIVGDQYLEIAEGLSPSGIEEPLTAAGRRFGERMSRRR